MSLELNGASPNLLLIDAVISNSSEAYLRYNNNTMYFTSELTLLHTVHSNSKKKKF